MPEHVDSAGDDRTANNAVRHQYRKLSDYEKERMVRVKDAGAAFVAEICALAGQQAPVEGVPLPDRNLEYARAAAEDAVMRAVRHITT